MITGKKWITASNCWLLWWYFITELIACLGFSRQTGKYWTWTDKLAVRLGALLLHPSLFLWLCTDVTDLQTHSDIWQHNATPHASSHFLPSPLSFFWFLSSESLPCRRNTPSRPALPALWNKGLIGWCRAVVTLLSLNQSFQQLLSRRHRFPFPSPSSSPSTPFFNVFFFPSDLSV